MRFMRNPFGRPYVVSKKWVIWSCVIIPYGIYANVTSPDSKSAKLTDWLSTIVIVPIIFVGLPWLLMRFSRAVRGKTPQGKTYGSDGVAIDGEVLILKTGRFIRTPVRATLIHGVVEIPAGRVEVGRIQSIKAGDPRAPWIKFPILFVSLTVMPIYFYCMMQPFLLIMTLKLEPFINSKLHGPALASNEAMYSSLRSNGFTGLFVYSDALLKPTLFGLGILVAMVVFKVLTEKSALIINLFDGQRMVMPFTYSINGVSVIAQNKRIKRFTNKVKRAARATSQ